MQDFHKLDKCQCYCYAITLILIRKWEDNRPPTPMINAVRKPHHNLLRIDISYLICQRKGTLPLENKIQLVRDTIVVFINESYLISLII